jgi:hypothetical protein
MIIGFTGTRQGMTQNQRISFVQNTCYFVEDVEFHHGDCVGADEQAHLLIVAHAKKIVIHPPSDDKLRAFCDRFSANLNTLIVVMPDRSYIDRNHDIVNSCDMLIAAPAQNYNILRSGTWATIRYARERGKRVNILYP